jgi:dienelactone hydrolase
MALMAALLVVMGSLAACQADGSADAEQRKVAAAGSTVSTVGIPVATAATTGTADDTATASPTVTSTPTATPTARAAATATPTVTAPLPSATSTSSATLKAPSTLTPNQATWTIAAMAARTYGGGTLTDRGEEETTRSFTRNLITYASDGLTIYGFMNTPTGPGPFPVIIVLHGYVEPSQYGILTYTTRYADALARAGYIVIHPNLRNFPPSDQGEDVFRTGMTADILNLIAIVHAQGGQPGLLAAADPQRIGLWGHSLGGGLALRVITISPLIKATLLYAALSGDEQRNFDYVYRASAGKRGVVEYHTPPEIVREISPLFHLERVRGAVSIHHGGDDAGIPLFIAADLCDRLQKLGKTVECFTYTGQGHIFAGSSDELLIQRSLDFFATYLRP